MERINAVTFAPFVQEVPLKRRNQTESETDERKDGSKLCDFCTERCAEDSIFREH